MMMAALWPAFARDLPPKVVSGGLAISGVYDLRDVPNVPSINNDVRLKPAETWRLSPIGYPPATDAPLYLAAGGKELPPFLDQNRAFGQHWKKVLAQDVPCPDDNHFSILEKLRDPSSGLFRGAMKMMGL
jgi:arylformamidase